MTATLPNVGDLNWGPALNNYISSVVQSTANSALQDILSHESATDPHGDRAYANSLIAPFFSNANLPGGFVELTAGGKVPSNLIPGPISNIFDVKASFGALGNGVTDDSAAINNALLAAAVAGGGEVWLANGNYAVGSTLIIGSNTWLNLSPGATITRIANPGVPAVMLANFTSSTTPAPGNILVSGGTWTVGATTAQPCDFMRFLNAEFVSIQQTIMINSPLPASDGIVLGGCTAVNISECQFVTTGAPTQIRSNYSQNACCRVEASNSAGCPGALPGAYTQQGCQGVVFQNNLLLGVTTTDVNGPFTSYAYFVTTSFNVTIPHNNILVSGCYANGCAQQFSFTVSSWINYTTTQNQILNCGPSISTVGITTPKHGGTNTLQLDIELWVNISTFGFQNSWNHHVGDVEPKCRRVVAPNLVVEVVFAFTVGVITDNTLICTLPATYRPATPQRHHVICRTGSPSSAYAYFLYGTDGTVRCFNHGGLINGTDIIEGHHFVSLDG